MNRRPHRGNDLSPKDRPPCGAPILAVADGTVVHAGYRSSGAGYTVHVEHSNVEVDVPGVRYEVSTGNLGTLRVGSTIDIVSKNFHMARNGIHVRRGQRVTEGQQLGVMGCTGSCSGCHVHFELRIGSDLGSAIDPEPVVLYDFTLHHPNVEQWRSLVEQYWWPVLPEMWREYVFAVMWGESRGNPAAVNPSSQASGLYQHLPQYWAQRSAAAGFANRDIYDPEANIAVAAWLWDQARTNYLRGNWTAWSTTLTAHPWSRWLDGPRFDGSRYHLREDEDMTFTVRFGMTDNPWVEELQQTLNVYNGANLTVDGDYGPKTRQSVGAWQQRMAGFDFKGDDSENVTAATWGSFSAASDPGGGGGTPAPHHHRLVLDVETEEA